MGHLCFGSFLKILSLCSPRSTTNKFLCGTMLLSVNPVYDIRDDDGTVAHLVNCTNNLSPNVTDFISKADTNDVLACFENKIIPRLYPEKMQHIIHAITDLLFKDEYIDDSVRVGTITTHSKGYYRIECRYNLAEFLTDFFFFVIQSDDNKSGQPYIREITKGYIQSFEPMKDNITLVDYGVSSGLTITVQGKGFNDAFVPVAKENLNLRNPEDYQIYRLKIEDNEFTYLGLKKYLNINIGRYVYSRTEMERYRADGELGGILKQ